MDSEDRTAIMVAMNKAIESFQKEFNGELLVLLKIEVQELKSDNFALGEKIIYDEISAYKE